MTDIREEVPRLRIAVLSRQFDASAGGAERYSVSLVEQLAARHDIEVFCQRHAATVPGVMVRHVPQGPRPRWMNQIWFAAYTAWQCRRGFDVVHSHEATWFGNVQTIHVRPIKVNLFAGRRGLGRWARWLSIGLSPRLVSYLIVERLRLSARPDRAIVAVSAPLRAELHAAYPALRSTHIDIVPPGVSAWPNDGTAREAVRQAQGASPSNFVLLFVANDHRKKGLPTLLRALAKLPTTLMLWVVGGTTELRDSQRLAAELGVSERTRFVGRVSQPGPFYRAADLLVHPALEDTFGMVVPEAMSQRLPVVVSTARWCGVADGLRDGVEAVLVDVPTDADAVADAIHRVSDDAAWRTRLADAGQAFAARFNWEQIARQQEAIYREQAARSR